MEGMAVFPPRVLLMVLCNYQSQDPSWCPNVAMLTCTLGGPLSPDTARKK